MFRLPSNGFQGTFPMIQTGVFRFVVFIWADCFRVTRMDMNGARVTATVTFSQQVGTVLNRIKKTSSSGESVGELRACW